LKSRTLRDLTDGGAKFSGKWSPDGRWDCVFVDRETVVRRRRLRNFEQVQEASITSSRPWAAVRRLHASRVFAARHVVGRWRQVARVRLFKSRIQMSAVPLRRVETKAALPSGESKLARRKMDRPSPSSPSRLDASGRYQRSLALDVKTIQSPSRENDGE